MLLIVHTAFFLIKKKLDKENFKVRMLIPSSRTRSESPQPPSSPMSPISAAAIEAAPPSIYIKIKCTKKCLNVKKQQITKTVFFVTDTNNKYTNSSIQLKILKPLYSCYYILPFVVDAAPSNNVLLTVNKGQLDSFIKMGTGGLNNFAFGLIAGNCDKNKFIKNIFQQIQILINTKNRLKSE